MTLYCPLYRVTAFAELVIRDEVHDLGEYSASLMHRDLLAVPGHSQTQARKESEFKSINVYIRLNMLTIKILQVHQINSTGQQ